MATQPSSRPLYTPQQLHEVYHRIRLPSKFRYEPGDFSREVVRHRDGIGFLGALQRHCLVHVPFENLDLHYSPHHRVSVHPDAMFTKIIAQGTGRGGYCMENNAFLGTVLRSLGFIVMSVGARVNSQMQPGGSTAGMPTFGGWSHMVNLVTIRSETYMVDVGFGPGGPTHPLPLTDGAISMNVPPGENIRLRRDAIPENEDQSNKLWLVETRTVDEGSWNVLYCFEDNVCFLPQDFEVMNFHTSVSRTSLFTYRMIASKSLLDEATDSIIGDVVLYERSVHRRLRGNKEVVAVFKTEQDRIEALEKYFNIRLSVAQREGIKGMSTEIGGR